jgi:hypothetical protein
LQKRSEGGRDKGNVEDLDVIMGAMDIGKGDEPER